MRLFVVREEGGLFEYLNAWRWLAAIHDDVPIFGLQLGNRRWVYDRILAAYGLSPIRRANDAMPIGSVYWFTKGRLWSY